MRDVRHIRDQKIRGRFLDLTKTIAYVEIWAKFLTVGLFMVAYELLEIP